MAFLRASFPRVFRHQHQAEDLGPVGDDIPERLPVLAVDVILRVERNPARPGDRQSEVNECSTTNRQARTCKCPDGRRLSPEPISTKYLVATTNTSTPSQSAIAFS